MYQVFIELLPGFKLNLFISWYEVSRGHFYNIYTSIIRQGLSFSSMVIYCPITVILKLMINYIINIQVVLGGRDIYKTKCGSETDQFIFILSHSGLKTTKFTPSSPNCPKTGPDSSQVTPGGPSDPLIDVITVFIIIVFKICGSSK